VTHRSHASRYLGQERRQARPSPLKILLAITAIAGIAYATLCPISMRPHLATADEERFGAYFVLGFMLFLAAPRRRATVTFLVFAIAFAFEAGQLLIPGRDARLSDALVKALGGDVGAQAGFSMFALRRFIDKHVNQSRTGRQSVHRGLRRQVNHN